MRGRAHDVVALGGGHGLAATLSSLRRLQDELTVDGITAVVTVADNGGSSGRLRGEFGVLPPGDLRMALAALCKHDEWGRTWADVVQHRFTGDGDMRGHVVGNLLIVSLWEIMGDHVRALDWVGRLLGAQGRVLPMATTPMDITAWVRGVDPAHPSELSSVSGQVQVATTTGYIESVALDPAEPEACPEAVQAVLSADWVFLGPGSWFTSLIPHLLVPALRQALEDTDARLVVVLNLAPQVGETGGLTPVDHLRVLVEHAPGLRIDTVLADPVSLVATEDLGAHVEALGARLVLTPLAASDGTARHDDALLARAFATLMDSRPPRG